MSLGLKALRHRHIDGHVVCCFQAFLKVIYCKTITKKCVFWKLTHCRGLKCFIKESRTQKVKVLEKHEKDVARSGFELADQWIVWSLSADRLQKGGRVTDWSMESSYLRGQFFHYILLRNYGSRLVVCMFKPKQSLESWANWDLSPTRFFQFQVCFTLGRDEFASACVCVSPLEIMLHSWEKA